MPDFDVVGPEPGVQREDLFDIHAETDRHVAEGISFGYLVSRRRGCFFTA